MEIILISLFIFFFAFITWYRFNWGLFFLILLLPTYLIRFNIGSLPITLLEVMIWVILVAWLIRFKNNATMQQCNNLFKKHKFLFISIIIFLLAATFSIFTSTNIRAAAGEWKAFYIEPFLIFLVLVTTINKKIRNSDIILFALILCGLATSILAIYQHFTGWFVPHSFWENRNTFRVTGWYGYPNGVGLFLAPLFPLALYLIKRNFYLLKNRIWNLEFGIWKKESQILYSKFYIQVQLAITSLFIPTSIAATYFAKSTGGLVGILAGVGILLLIYKKTRIPMIISSLILVLIFLFIPQLSGLRQEVFMQDRSGQIRISMWQDTINFLKDNPIWGSGLASYKKRIVPYHTTVNGEGIEIFHHPHNIFLTIWVNTGLLGLVGFILILIWFFKTAITTINQQRSTNNITIKQYKNSSIVPFLTASLTTVIVTGLVDSPYIKNDLALLFWLLPALLVISTGQKKEDKLKS